MERKNWNLVAWLCALGGVGALLTLVAGCSSFANLTGGYTDGGSDTADESPSDLAMPDLILAPDLAPCPDLTPDPDLASPPDLAPYPDLIPPPDLIPQPRLLIVAEGASPQGGAYAMTQLQMTGAFASVDVALKTNTLPDAKTLRQKYDAIFVMTTAISPDFGNLLADYFDAGGRVVLALCGNVATGGRFGDPKGPYALFGPLGAYGNELRDQMIVAEMQSPVSAGIHALSYVNNANIAYALTQNVAATVALWTPDNFPLAVRGVVKGRGRVDLNFCADYPNAVYLGGWTGDGIALIRNALFFQ